MKEKQSLHMKDMTIKHQAYAIANKITQIKHFRTRLLKIRNSIDYLLEHPFSQDVGNRTINHKRDNTRRVSQIKRKEVEDIVLKDNE